MKKKCLALLLTLCLVIGLAPISTPAYQQSSISLYKDILDKYHAALSDPDFMDYGGAGLCYLCRYEDADERLDVIGYAFRDLDGNGIEELLISNTENAEYPQEMMFDLYTISGNNVVQILLSGERDRYYPFTEGVIYNEGSWSAMGSLRVSYYLDGDSLSLIEAFFYDGFYDEESPWFYSTMTDIPPSESDLPADFYIPLSNDGDFAGILPDSVKPLEIYYTPFSEYEGLQEDYDDWYDDDYWEDDDYNDYPQTGTTFTDEWQIDHLDAVQGCVDEGIIGGYPDGSYQPQKPVTRAEMSKMLCYAFYGSDAASGSWTSFQDTSTHWAREYISFCYQEGIVSGVGGNRFNPNGYVTGEQAAKMLLVAMGYDAVENGFIGADWAYNVNELADWEGLYENLYDIDPTDALSRDDTAQMIWNALQGSSGDEYYPEEDFWTEDEYYPEEDFWVEDESYDSDEADIYGYDISMSVTTVPAYQWFEITVTPYVSGWSSIYLYAKDENGVVYDLYHANSQETTNYYFNNVEGAFEAYAVIYYPDGTSYTGQSDSEYLYWFVSPRDRNSPYDVSVYDKPSTW